MSSYTTRCVGKQYFSETPTKSSAIANDTHSQHSHEKSPVVGNIFYPADESVAAEKSHSWQKNLAPFTIPQVIAEFDSVVLSHQNSGERRHAVAGDGYVGDTSIAMYSRLS